MGIASPTVGVSVSATSFPLLLLFASIVPVPASLSRPTPRLVPIRYDVQLQLPTASDRDPLVPTFFGTARLDFQLTAPLQNSGEEQQPIRLTLLAQQLEAVENCTLSMSGGDTEQQQQQFQLAAELKPPRELDLVLLNGPSRLAAGRYTLDIGRFQGVITYQKGLFYRDAGGLPLLASDLFLEHAPALFPQLDGGGTAPPLQKTTTKVALIHPQGTLALSSMQPMGPSEALNKHWRITRFVQAPNLAAYLLSIAVLPDSIYERTTVHTRPPLFVWTNRLLHQPTLKQELARLAGLVFDALSALLGGDPLPLSALNVLMIGEEFNGTQSFGMLALPLARWSQSDYAHRVAVLAEAFARQWLGGMSTVGAIEHFCLQEDLVGWLAHKTVERLLDGGEGSGRAQQRFALAQYVRTQLAETFLAPGESVALPNWAGEQEIFTHCGLKGVQLLRSLEQLAGEKALLSVIRQLLAGQRYRPFHLDHFVELLRPRRLADSIDLGQAFDFWFRSGGIPNMAVEKRGERLRLRQQNEGRQTQLNGAVWAKMPLWPLPIAIRNLTLPFRFMLSQVLELAPLDPKMLPLTNLGFEHLYRVNYDAESWERIVRELVLKVALNQRNKLSQGPSLDAFSAIARAQLLGDFCYFNAVGQVGAPGGRVQRQFLQLLRDHYEQFELCEFYAFWCNGGSQRRIPMDAESRTRYATVLKEQVWPALWNHTGYECGGPGAASDAANALCQTAFGRNCF